VKSSAKKLKEEFSREGPAQPEKEYADAPCLYPNSTQLFPIMFQGLYRSFYALKDEPLEPRYAVESEDDWNPFVIRFDWITHTSEDATFRIDPLRDSITKFIDDLREIGNISSPGQAAKVKIDLDKKGGFLAFHHPDEGFLLLQKIISSISRVCARTDAIISRKPFINLSPAQEGMLIESGNTVDALKLDEINKYYQLNLSQSPDQFDEFSFTHLPARPYASLKDALTIANLASTRKGLMVIDMEGLRKAIDDDCGRSATYPYLTFH
jgi:hypothetical protein